MMSSPRELVELSACEFLAGRWHSVNRPVRAKVADASERVRELVRSSILADRSLLFAENRGDAPEELSRRKQEIEEIGRERTSCSRCSRHLRDW
jgi:hypothetical protein